MTFTGVDFTGGLTGTGAPPTDYPVQAGDYLEINGGGFVHMIAPGGVTTNKLVLLDQVTVANATPNFRIIRQPRPVPGEREPLELSGGIIIDLSVSQNVPVRNDGRVQSYYENHVRAVGKRHRPGNGQQRQGSSLGAR